LLFLEVDGQLPLPTR